MYLAIFIKEFYIDLCMRVPTGSKILDNVLEGGYETDIITTVYGPSGAGKTTFCILSAVSVAKRGKKVVYIDTEGGFSPERMAQISKDYKKLLKNIIFLRPSNFKEQKESFEKLKDLVNDKIGIIIVDTISMLYRLELGKDDSVYETNRELGKQLSYLAAIARKKNIPVLIANQVYADFDNPGMFKMVGGDLLKYSSKCLIELMNKKGSNRLIFLRKHRSIGGNKELGFKLVDKGLEKIKEKRFLF
jgi:DNA repair protein RadB